MNNGPELVVGCRPWFPSPDSLEGDELDRYDVPLTGFFSQNDQVYLYDCYIGESMPECVYRYIPVSPTDVVRLENTSGGRQVVEVIELFDIPSYEIAIVENYEIKSVATIGA